MNNHIHKNDKHNHDNHEGHSHHHDHKCGHGHHHHHDASGLSGKKLAFATVLNMVITAAELIGGIMSGSLALISDALHNFGDGISLVISYFSLKISGKERDIKKTFGYKRAGIIAAVFNAVFLLAVSIFLLKEAFEKLFSQPEINASIVIWVALIGLFANIGAMALLHKDSKDSINIKSAYLHLLSDTLSSVAVVLGAVAMMYYKIFWLDAVITVIINAYISYESFKLIKETINILMQGAPAHIDIAEIAETLEEIEDINNIHHVHVWSLDEKNVFFECHVNLCRNISVEESMRIQEIVEEKLKKFGINHSTIQVEFNGCEGKGLVC